MSMYTVTKARFKFSYSILEYLRKCYESLNDLLSRSSRPDVFIKKGVLRNVTKFTGKHPCQDLFLIKLPETCNFIKKEILAQVFYCEFCEISKSTFLHRTPLVAASDFHNILGSILGIRDIEIDYSINEI